MGGCRRRTVKRNPLCASSREQLALETASGVLHNQTLSVICDGVEVNARQYGVK